MAAVLNAPKRDHRSFTLAMCAATAAIVFFGFSFTVFPDLIARARPLILYLHVASAVAWLLLLVAQATLVRRRQVALHRRLGIVGIWLGGFAAASSLATALVLRHESVIVHGADRATERIAFLAIPLSSFLLFSIYFGLAILFRTRLPLHRRFILVAAAVLTTPALARVPFEWAMYLPLIVPAGLILVLCMHDFLRTRSVHLASWTGVVAIITMQVLTTYLAFGHPDWWVATAKFMIGV